MTATQTLTTIERSILARKGDASPVGRSADRLENTIERTMKSLPATPIVPTAPVAPVAPAAEILIVEDNRLNLKLYRDLLEARGHQIAQSHDVNRIVSAMRLSRPDLILVDICAPRRYGLEAASEIRRQPELCDIPMIGIAEMYRPGAEIEILDAGCDACIAKPISVPEFLRVVEIYLNR
jgi:two-component system cell cycle response regulator DivK